MQEGTYVLAGRLLPDGRELTVYLLVTGTARLVVSPYEDSSTWDDGW